MNSDVRELMIRYGGKGSFTKVAPTQEMLAEVEEKLGFVVSGQFLEYLNAFSHGGIGFEILGIGFDGSISFLEETLEYRENGLPNNLLVIENCDEWLYCIDMGTGEVVSWSTDEDSQVEYDCFNDYLLDRLNDAIENM